jgi:hypothetical protein
MSRRLDSPLERAHLVLPYSNATEGNITVSLSGIGEEARISRQAKRATNPFAEQESLNALH